MTTKRQLLDSIGAIRHIEKSLEITNASGGKFKPCLDFHKISKYFASENRRIRSSTSQEIGDILVYNAKRGLSKMDP